MKKFAILLSIGLLVCTFSIAKADLIGIQGKTEYPDVLFDAIGHIDYTLPPSGPGQFVLTARDQTLTMGPSGPQYGLLLGLVRFTISLSVDQSGNLVGTGTMEEKVTQAFQLFPNGPSYLANDILLSGTVYRFGWGESGGNLGKFDFLVKDVDGLFTNSPINWPTGVDTGIWAYAANLKGWTGTWESEFHLAEVKGDKGPVPEPATMLLLGSGLIGIGIIVRRKFKK